MLYKGGGCIVIQPYNHDLGRKYTADCSSRNSGGLVLLLVSMKIKFLNTCIGEIIQNIVPVFWRERKVTSFSCVFGVVSFSHQYPLCTLCSKTYPLHVHQARWHSQAVRPSVSTTAWASSQRTHYHYAVSKCRNCACLGATLAFEQCALARHLGMWPGDLARWTGHRPVQALANSHGKARTPRVEHILCRRTMHLSMVD